MSEKEIGKLLELLNEYETPRSGIVFKSYDDYDGTFYGVDIDGETEIAWSDSMICSKRFGFIKWLVENEKVKVGSIPEFYHVSDHCSECVNEGITDNTIMLLSIQKDLIEYLLSILR